MSTIHKNERREMHSVLLTDALSLMCIGTRAHVRTRRKDYYVVVESYEKVWKFIRHVIDSEGNIPRVYEITPNVSKLGLQIDLSCVRYER